VRLGEKKESDMRKYAQARLLIPKNTVWSFAHVVREVDAWPRILMGRMKFAPNAEGLDILKKSLKLKTTCSITASSHSSSL